MRAPRKPPRRAINLAPSDRLRHSREESAAILSISLRSLDYAIQYGRIKAVHDGAGVFIMPSELVRYARESRTGPVSKPDAPAA